MPQNVKLSENFYLKEFLRSRTASKYGYIEQFGPSEFIIGNLKELVENILQPLRYVLGPIFIASGYRCTRVNKKAKGAKRSQHLYGMAADIDNPELNRKYFEFILNHLEFDQLIWEFGDNSAPDWVHVSYNPVHNRKQVLRARRIKSKWLKRNRVIYEPFNMAA